MITPLIKSFLIKFKNKWKKNLLIKKLEDAPHLEKKKKIVMII